MPAVLNIGWARSASTAFRQNFLRQHPEILAVDRGQLFSEGPLAIILRYIKSADDSEFEHYLPTLRAQWAVYQQMHRDRIICITDEELSIGLLNTNVSPSTIAVRCGQLFPGARTLAIVRDQVDAIRSFYALSQGNSHESVISLSDWVRRFFLSPEEGEDFYYLFSYMATLRAYLEWQSRHDVFVLQYDKLNTEHTAAYREIARWLTISEKACELLRNDKVGVSPAIPFRAPEFFSGHKEAPRERSARNEYSIGQEDEIRALFEKDNAELAHEFGVVFSLKNSKGQRVF